MTGGGVSSFTGGGVGGGVASLGGGGVNSFSDGGFGDSGASLGSDGLSGVVGSERMTGGIITIYSSSTLTEPSDSS